MDVLFLYRSLPTIVLYQMNLLIKSKHALVMKLTAIFVYMKKSGRGDVVKFPVWFTVMEDM